MAAEVALPGHSRHACGTRRFGRIKSLTPQLSIAEVEDALLVDAAVQLCVQSIGRRGGTLAMCWGQWDVTSLVMMRLSTRGRRCGQTLPRMLTKYPDPALGAQK